MAERPPDLSPHQHRQRGGRRECQKKGEFLLGPRDVLGREPKDSGPRWCFHLVFQLAAKARGEEGTYGG